MLDLFITPYLNIFGFKLYYYGLVYALGFLGAYIFFRYQAKNKRLDLTLDQVDTLMIYIIIGGILGGRLGEFLFFQPQVLFTDPLQIFMLRQGGMSIHGGILGFLGAIWLFRRKHKQISTYDITDNAAMIAAFTLFFGRIANFINAELCGRLTSVPWAVKLHSPTTEGWVQRIGCEGYRHPSQLYEALKNLFIGFTLLFIEKNQLKTNRYKPGYKTWIFVILYGILRVLTNIWRDDVLWFFGILSTGQFLSLLMVILAGIILMKYYWIPMYKEKKSKKK